jgi:IclR family pca regulon transcriptional regulator
MIDGAPTCVKRSSVRHAYNRPTVLAAVDREADFVQSLQRGLDVIRAFADGPILTSTEVANATGLARAAARRFLLTLVELDYVRVENRLFRLSPRVLELGRAYLTSLRLPALAQAELRALVDAAGESTTIAVLDGADIVYVAHVPARRIMAIKIEVGTRDPAFATALGRVLLAGLDPEALEDYLATAELPAIQPRTLVDVAALRAALDKVRRQGYALVDQELEAGLRAVAVPIRDAEGRVTASLNFAVHAGAWTTSAIRRELLPRLLEAAAAIESEATVPTTHDAPLTTARLQRVEGGDVVQSLQRGLAVIRAFDEEHPALTLSEVARVTGLARAAARRFLLTLVELGYMHVDGRLFRLSPRLLDLGRPYLSSLTVPELALPHLRTFAAEVRESSTIAVLDGADIVYVAHAAARRILSVSVVVGSRDPAAATALGRALLAWQPAERVSSLDLQPYTERTIVDHAALRRELARVARQGYALVDQELEDGLRALAAPIRDSRDQVVAAVNVAVHASRWPVDAVRRELLPRLLETAAAIERDVRAAV